MDPDGLLSEGRFRAVLSSISDGVFTVDSEWRIACFNRAAEEITGHSRDGVIGRSCHEVFRTNICTEACALRYTMETGHPIVDLDVTIETRGGETIPVSVSTALLRDREGAVIGGVETFRDLRQVRHLQKAVLEERSFDDIIGNSPLMRELFAKLDIVAASGSTVLLTGETGTGKELFARAIHRHSSRRDGPFVAVNCGALPETLVEAELFGHVKGAFTGAIADKPGRIAQADGGTLLLDEIGDLPQGVQVKLLRFLQDLSFEPLGDTRTHRADVRIICATHRSLTELMREGKFREDLFYRINVINLHIPPLRQRPEDIPLLVQHFVDSRVAMRRGAVTGISTEALGLLLTRSYPGNVRELENIVEHGFVLCPAGLIRPEHLPHDHPRRPAETSGRGARRLLDALEREEIVRALEENEGNRLKAARALGIHKTTLFRRIKRLGIAPPRIDGRTKRKASDG